MVHEVRDSSEELWMGNNPKWRYKEDAAVLHQCTNQETDNTISPIGLAFGRCEKGVFFHRNVEQILTRTYEENQKHDLLDRKQERQEDNKGYNVGHRELYQKQEFLDKKQKSSEDTTEYYAEIMGKSIHSRKQN